MKEQSTRNRIIKSAEDHLVACGFADVSMKSISEKAKVNISIAGKKAFSHLTFQTG
ncbi:hypothetical protein SAMN05518672_103563 [Chitinophaga sp. CF118]|uniref:TetR/AcrR family transcriptional regulator n=1 Tax=Chitinophaga sp. CF118 TaxID=1884367 RepID=UPI0008E39700|nr:TetR/AcrR family transcriptional regulator [Chitinophaga sp. CF118]SFD86132.1 hypothetical protein SAMN05518672_103563 [Chitinophaga sp. CF118]